MNAHSQRGASLLIALVMLILITLLAVSSIQESTLQARITGNLLEEKHLVAAAEAGLRDAERRLAKNEPPDTCPESLTQKPCIQGIVPISSAGYDTDFVNKSLSYGDSGNTTTLDRTVHWYLRAVPQGSNGSCTDPNNTVTGKGCVSYYEVNSQAYHARDDSTAAKPCAIDVVCLRAVIARQY
ncbi:PilX N-terminal domain-containing pilus assembly protein [Pseudomonas benzopyrenica]|uniref:PilX N-terminal domain-containing pilus assembly protein n=1 Tax=Pseudomonas benzopyrenica TaxID=2993566 RepID=A0ABZ2FMG1_9PSED